MWTENVECVDDFLPANVLNFQHFLKFALMFCLVFVKKLKLSTFCYTFCLVHNCCGWKVGYFDRFLLCWNSTHWKCTTHWSCTTHWKCTTAKYFNWACILKLLTCVCPITIGIGEDQTTINGLSASPPHLKGTMKEKFKLGQKRCAGGPGCGPVGKTHKLKFYSIAWCHQSCLCIYGKWAKCFATPPKGHHGAGGKWGLRGTASLQPHAKAPHTFICGPRIGQWHASHVQLPQGCGPMGWDAPTTVTCIWQKWYGWITWERQVRHCRLEN